VIRSLGLLIGATVAFWLVLVYPAVGLWGESALSFSAVAGLICFFPAAVTMIWSEKALQGRPEHQLLAVMGGMGVRMAFVVSAGMALFLLHPDFHYQRFLIWVVVFYLVTLALEITILLTRSMRATSSQKIHES
jgi:hypothetical protein